MIGCGFRFNAMNSDLIFISGSIGIRVSKTDKTIIGILKIVGSKLTPLNERSPINSLFVYYGWVKTGRETIFQEDKAIRGEIDDQFLSVSSNVKHVATVLIESMDGGLKFGFNQKPNTHDIIFEIIDPPSKEIKDRANKCVVELINTYNK